MKNDFEKAIANLKEGEIILGARVAKDGTEILINGKVGGGVHGTILVMLCHAVYAAAIKEAQEHNVPMEMAKMLAELPIMMAFKTFKEIKDDEEILADVMKQVNKKKKEEVVEKDDDDIPATEEADVKKAIIKLLESLK